MNATAPLTHFIPQHWPRPGLAADLRVRVRRSALDRRLATGADPAGDADLARRAEQLTTAATRERIANAIERVIADAAGPVPVLSPRVPLARAAVNSCAPRLRAIAGRLHSDRFVSPRGVAQAAILISEGSSPLYAVGSSDDVLRHRLAEIAKALG
jgi:hypothetical protein